MGAAPVGDGEGTGTPVPVAADVALPVTGAQLREALNGAPQYSDDLLDEIVDIALGHIAPLLRAEYVPDPTLDDEDPDAGAWPPWPADLHDGVLLAAMLTLRNRESPSASSSESGYAAAGFGVPSPSVPPIAWDPRIRHRVAAFLSPGVFVG